MPAQFKGALVGFGQVAENGHVPAFKARSGIFEITAVAEADEKRRQAAAACFPGAKIYPSFEELLKNEKSLDFVDIATPPTFHFAAVQSALKKRLHVMCEKPLVLKSTELKKLAKTAAAKDLCLFTVHNWKKALPILKAKELIDSGAAGQVSHVELHVLRSQAAPAATGGNWRENPALSGGGIMVDHGWHNFYLACHLTGKMPKSVRACLKYYEPRTATTEHTCSCHIDFGGATSLVYLTWQSPIRKNFAVVYGDKGVIEIRDSAVSLETKGTPPQVFETGDKLSAGSAHPAWMTLLLDDFAAELRDASARGKNLLEARACLALIENGYKSAERGTSATLRF